MPQIWYDENGNPYLDSNGNPVAPPPGAPAYDHGLNSVPGLSGTPGPMSIPNVSVPDPTPSYNPYLTANNTNVANLSAQNTAALQQLQQQQAEIFKQQNNLGVQNQNYVTAGLGNAQTLNQQNNGLINQSWQSTNAANAADQQSLGQYTQALNNATGWDLANIGNLQGAYNSMGILKAGGYGPDVVSQAQFAQADPASIAMQNQVMGELGGWASGAHNLTSQAASAYADPTDVANQRNAANALQGIANGSKDISVGQGDPESYAAALDAMARFKGLSTPEVTAAERFIYEQARLQQEQDDRANRAAVLTNMRQRGMSGSGMELTDAALGAQRTSQNRLLSDLGAQSNAISRAMTALQGYGSMASNLNAQGNAIAMQNQTIQAQAQNAAYQAYATLRAQGFSEEYSRRAAADQMAEFNNTQMLNATGMQGDLASQMRSQSFNEDFSRKSAADSMAQFNKEQSQISQRWQEQYAAEQQNAAWGRATDMFDANNKVGQNYVTNSTGLFNAQTGVTGAAANRVNNSINTAGQLNANSTAGWQNAFNTGIASNQSQSQTSANQLAAMTQLAGLGMNNNTNITQLTNQNNNAALGYQTGQQAADYARQQAENDPGGLFGTGILGKKDPLNPGNWFRGKLG